jgi:hypothetical protein
MAQESNRIKSRLRFGSDDGAEAPLEKPTRKANKAATDSANTKNSVPMEKVLAVERAPDAHTGKSRARLRFSEEAQVDPALRKPIRNANKAARKFARAESKVPTKKGFAIERATDANTGKTVARLRFGEMSRDKPSGKLMDALPRAPAKLLYESANQQNNAENSGDVGNVGVDAVSGARGLGESTFRAGQSRVRHAQKLRPYRQMEKAEARLDRANVRALQKQAAQEHGASNPLSRWRQRQSVKQGYVARQAQSAGKRTTEKVTEKIGQAFRKNKKSMVVGGLIVMMFAMVMNALSSCSPMVQSGFQAIIMSTYPAEDADLLAAERMYSQMEKDLKKMLDNYERDHDYHEYHYDLDELWHDPHALMAIISAWYGGEVWTADQVYGTLEMLFEKQYILTEEVKKETRYRQEERTGQYTYTDPVTGERELRDYTYYVDVPYDYFICNVTLINFNLSHLPVYIMSEEKVGMYAMYMSTLGNKPDLFRGNRYASTLKNPVLYDIPEEALEDPRFAALIAEAKKYLGYPYVWGGSKPTTSFDCSGFVSWVYTQTGVCNTGRLGATGLYGVCAPITPEEARPGDMIFFQGTINRATGITHVGIYVGNGMMIHCGNPITYADLSDRYWQEHFYGFGRPRTMI